MFYSHFILAKKGPLATVWMAAHLERKLRKNQVYETNICASVDSILFPDVPIALRLSGHLLVGVVRIYSRKVNYLYQDCNEVLAQIKRAFTSVKIDLPAGAMKAPVDTVTLPREIKNYEFDEIEEEEIRFGIPPTHVTTPDQIRLQDWRQGSFSGGTPMFYINQDFQSHGFSPSHGFDPFMDDVLPPFPMDAMDMDNDSLEGAPPRSEGGTMPDNIPEQETLRSVVDAPQDKPFTEGLEELERSMETINGSDGQNEEEMERPVLEEVSLPGETTAAFGSAHTPTRERISADISGDEDLLTTALGGLSQGLTVMPTPSKRPAEKKRKQTKKRKITLDKSIVLSNDFMRRQLEDTEDICRVRKKAPCTKLELWKAHRSSHFQQAFLAPSLPGMCTALHETFEKVFTVRPLQVSFVDPPDSPYKKGHLGPSTYPEAPEIETARHAPPVNNGALPEWSEFPPQRMDEDTFQVNKEVESESRAPGILEPEPIIEPGGVRNRQPVIFSFESPIHHSGEAEQVQIRTPSIGVSVYNEGDEQFQKILQDDARNAGSVGLSEQNFATAPDTHGATKHSSHEEHFTLSNRTRAIALYLKEAFKKSNNQDNHLSLRQILVGRTRKEAARMFFETLVLKSKDYIDVQQEEPYADVLLSATSKLTMANFQERHAPR